MSSNTSLETLRSSADRYHEQIAHYERIWYQAPQPVASLLIPFHEPGFLEITIHFLAILWRLTQTKFGADANTDYVRFVTFSVE